MKMRTLLFLLLTTVGAAAHDAPAGWAYYSTCCAGKDCRPVALPQSVRETPGGYQVPSGEVVPYGDVRVRDSKDDSFHWCTVNGAANTHTICIYVPGRGS